MLPRYRRVWLIERRADLYDPDKTVSAEVGKRFAPVEIFDDIGAQITLFVPKELIPRGTVPRKTGPISEYRAEQARRRAAASPDPGRP
jgi:hypothetical protein